MKNETKKNLVMIHMESLSNEIYHRNRHLFENLNGIIDRCIQYDKFYSTSTSTIMVIADLLFGNMTQFEKSTNINNLMSSELSKKSLINILEESNFSTKAIVCPKWSENDQNNLSKIMKNVIYEDNYEAFIQNIESSLSVENAFSLYIYNGFSGLAFLDEEENWEVSWKNGYRKSDHTVGIIFSILEKKGLIDNTIVVIYGDHGDDFWRHSFNHGYCHCIEPYSNMIHTPLFIFDSEYQGQKVTDVISNVDLREVILTLLCVEPKQDESMIFKNYRSKRQYAFSRNLFVNQRGSDSSLLKSYALSNGSYNLLVSQKGLELFFECHDPSNGLNLLNFYTIDHKGKISFKNKFEKVTSKHFIKAMGKSRREEIEKVFYEMRSELMANVKALYSSASKDHVWKNELAFEIINTQIEF